MRLLKTIPRHIQPQLAWYSNLKHILKIYLRKYFNKKIKYNRNYYKGHPDKIKGEGGGWGGRWVWLGWGGWGENAENCN